MKFKYMNVKERRALNTELKTHVGIVKGNASRKSV